MHGFGLKGYVVGYGSIDALGNNPWSSYQKSLDNVDYKTWFEDLGFMGYAVKDKDLLYPDGWKPKNNSRAQKFFMHATNLALAHSRLPIVPNVAVILSSTLSEGELNDENFPKRAEGKRIPLRSLVNTITDMCTYHVCNHWGFHGLSSSVAAACATGLVGIDYAMRILHKYDYVIVGGADAGIYKTTMEGFDSIGALSSDNRPFDDNRSGFVMGEGAGVMILQSKQNVDKYNSTVHAALYEPGHATEGLSLTSPAEDGRGAMQAMQQALKNAPVSVVDTVCCHATSTPIGDITEYQAIEKTFSHNPILWAPKSKLGHTVAASGVLETIHLFEAFRAKRIPHIQNLENCSFDTRRLLNYSNTNISSNQKWALNNSFGFGGKNMSQVIELLN